jgi:TetR/AcrR family transcriptional regulator
MTGNFHKENLTKTAEKILTVARAVFAEYGYNGTRMDEIARRANVNKATVYYQIGDKDTLYANVIHYVIGNVAQDIVRTVGLAKTPEEKLKAYIFCIAQAVDKNPEIPPIMMREIAAGGVNLPRLVVEDIVSVITTLMGILEEGTKKGLFIETIPFLVHMLILGSILFYKGSLPIKDRQTWLPASIRNKDQKIKGNVADEVAKLILRAVKK